MPHINELIDWTVVAYIVNGDRVLLVDHIALNEWLPVGGHVHLDENPDEALMRKISEECGLNVEITAERPTVQSPGTLFLNRPAMINIHRIDDRHRHVALVYFGRTDQTEAKLNPDDHREIKWFSKEELASRDLKIDEAVRFEALSAIEAISGQKTIN